MVRRLSARAIAAIAVTATTVTATAVGFALRSGEPAESATAGSDLPPATTQLHTVDLGTAPGADPERRIDLPPRDTQRFSTVGITWRDPAAELRGTAQVRTRAAAGARWSPWLDLETAEQGADAASDRIAGQVRGGTEPQWVGPSDGVQVRVVAASGAVSDTLPAGLRLELVDPGAPPRGAGGGTGGQGGGFVAAPAAPAEPEPTATEAEPDATPPAPTGQPAPTTPEAPAPTDPTTTEPVPTDPATTEPSPSATAAPSTEPPTVAPTEPAPGVTQPVPPVTTPAVPRPPTPSASPKPTGLVMPRHVTRAQWRADERINRSAPGFGTTTRAVFVHHTADRKTYDCADSPAIIRGIHGYHVRSRGWADIGYNFLVDRCGTLFEGRKGGVERPVVGAHTYGFNTNNMGVAVIGTYGTSGISNQVRSVLAGLAAYRLGVHGNDPAGKVQLTSGVKGKFAEGAAVTMNRISGHRDADFTECPGNALYRQLAAIRTEAAQRAGNGVLINPLAGGVAAAGTYYARGAATVSWTLGGRAGTPTGFAILVDGKPSTTAAATARSATVRLAAGRHAVAVRALYAGGRYATSGSQLVVSDTAAPTFPRKPELALRGGTVSTAAVPVSLSWRAADNNRLSSVAATAPAAKTFGATTGSWATTAKPAKATAWRLRATDVVGNAGTAAVTRTPVLLTEAQSARTGRWSSRSNGAHLGGKVLTSSTAKASLTWTFTGRSAALVVARGTALGKVDIIVDGKRAGTVDLRAGKTTYRQAVWTKSWPTAGRHRVKIVVLGTAKRPAVHLDGLAYLR